MTTVTFQASSGSDMLANLFPVPESTYKYTGDGDQLPSLLRADLVQESHGHRLQVRSVRLSLHRHDPELVVPLRRQDLLHRGRAQHAGHDLYVVLLCRRLDRIPSMPHWPEMTPSHRKRRRRPAGGRPWP